MKETEHLGLSQWDPSDRILRTDFNDDNAKIDAALAGLGSAKLGRSEIIQLMPSDGRQIGSSGWMPPIKDWNEWEYVCGLYLYPGKTVEDTNMATSWIADRDYEPRVFQPLPMPGFLLVLLPWHNADANVAGFYISDRFIPFYLDFPFKDIRQIGSGHTIDTGLTIINPHVAWFGGR